MASVQAGRQDAAFLSWVRRPPSDILTSLPPTTRSWIGDINLTGLLAQPFGDRFPPPAKILFRLAGTAITKLRANLCLKLSPLASPKTLGCRNQQFIRQVIHDHTLRGKRANQANNLTSFSISIKSNPGSSPSAARLAYDVRR
jgi:hypothetical protein